MKSKLKFIILVRSALKRDLEDISVPHGVGVGSAPAPSALITVYRLPAATCTSYGDLKRALLDRLGLTPEGHRRRDRLFAYAHQLLDAAEWWLRPEERSSQQVVR
ncbi:hypothetical protein N1851_015421 [Merluccius polli]|uniref:Uncharacterized protein n=1 Tax=Merluccius polli TaxID=89951 RepID=A0AA47MSV1_MERPO|nr:hypothetical protein N1851_015421 [Merluccius polli]